MKHARPFTSHVKMMVLTLTLPHTGRWFYQREIQLITGISNTPIRAALCDLEAFGLLTRRAHGNRQYYTINTDFLMYEEFKNIVLKTTGLGDHLRWMVRAHPDRLIAAFVCGNAASREIEAGSPIQVCVVGDIPENDLQKALENAKKRTQMEYDCLHFTPKKFAALRGKKDRAVMNLLAGQKVFVVGRAVNLESLEARAPGHP